MAELNSSTSPFDMSNFLNSISILFIIIFIVFALTVISFKIKEEYQRWKRQNYGEKVFDISKIPYESKAKLSPSTTFKNNPYNRYCGVEIECIKGASIFLDTISRYGFMKKSDGSLSEGGIELVSVPMNGDNLFNNIDGLCDLINEKNYSVDESCGLHIHLEVDPKDVELMKKIFYFYRAHENNFFNMLPKSRQSSGYCYRFDHEFEGEIKKIMNAKDLEQFMKVLYELKYYNPINEIHDKYGPKRYCWVNFHSVFYRGTLEIRSHAGTINKEKIKNWITMHLRLLNYIESHTLEELKAKNTSFSSFLKLFKKNIRDYIKLRTEKFKNDSEEDKILLKVGGNT